MTGVTRLTISVGAGLVALALICLLVKSANGVPVFPPMIGGEFQFHVMPENELDADGVPLAPPALSIGIAPATGGTPVACIDTPDRTMDYRVEAAVPVTGVRQPFKAFGYSQAGCMGFVSAGSENTGWTYPGMSPKEPDLLARLLDPANITLNRRVRSS